MTRLLERLATWLLGPRCHICGEHVFRREQPAHDYIEHFEPLR